LADDVIGWMSAHILPHEADVRRWLRRSPLGRMEEDDLIQEAYCRLAASWSDQSIRSGRAYFFTVAKNLLFERLRRNRIVRIDAAELELSFIEDEGPSPEQFCTARQQLALVHRLIEELSEPCRSVFKLRKIENLSQRETARRLGLTENVVEKQLASGLRTVLRRAAESGWEVVHRGRSRRDSQGNQQRNRGGRG
jgi:RNA polymerase sigma-70 factor (ECF subfamily)